MTQFSLFLVMTFPYIFALILPFCFLNNSQVSIRMLKLSWLISFVLLIVCFGLGFFCYGLDLRNQINEISPYVHEPVHGLRLYTSLEVLMHFCNYALKTLFLSIIIDVELVIKKIGRRLLLLKYFVMTPCLCMSILIFCLDILASKSYWNWETIELGPFWKTLFGWPEWDVLMNLMESST